MEPGGLDIFRQYLAALPDDLLESVTEDYVWLGGRMFLDLPASPEFQRRRECCREECSRRNVAYLYEVAEDSIGPRAA